MTDPSGRAQALAADLEEAVGALVTTTAPSAARIASARLAAERAAEAHAHEGAEDHALARAMARCLGGLERGEVPLGPVLLYLASAAAALSDAAARRARGAAPAAGPLDAARYEVESFGPGEPGPSPASGPDVSADSLTRGRSSS